MHQIYSARFSFTLASSDKSFLIKHIVNFLHSK